MVQFKYLGHIINSDFCDVDDDDDDDINKLKSCYNKNIERFVGNNRRYSVTKMLAELNLPYFEILISNCMRSFHKSCNNSSNILITNMNSLQLLSFVQCINLAVLLFYIFTAVSGKRFNYLLNCSSIN